MEKSRHWHGNHLNSKRLICWPDPDKVCLEGGCVHCNIGEIKTLVECIEYSKASNYWPMHIEINSRSAKGLKRCPTTNCLSYVSVRATRPCMYCQERDV